MRKDTKQIPELRDIRPDRNDGALRFLALLVFLPAGIIMLGCKFDFLPLGMFVGLGAVVSLVIYLRNDSVMQVIVRYHYWVKWCAIFVSVLSYLGVLLIIGLWGCNPKYILPYVFVLIAIPPICKLINNR